MSNRVDQAEELNTQTGNQLSTVQTKIGSLETDLQGLQKKTQEYILNNQKDENKLVTIQLEYDQKIAKMLSTMRDMNYTIEMLKLRPTGGGTTIIYQHGGGS